MATRSELYHMFGPKLFEAIALVVKDEINILRTRESLSERTNQQLLDAIDNKLTALEKFDWQPEV